MPDPLPALIPIAADLSSQGVQSRLAQRPHPPSRTALKPPACGSAVGSLPQAGLVSPAPRRAPMSTTNLPRGPGLFEVGRVNGERLITNVRRIAGADRAPGSALVTAATILLALLAAGLFVVSLTAQYRYVFAVKHQSVPSAIEAIGLDVRHGGLLAAGPRPGDGRAVRADRTGADRRLRGGVRRPELRRRGCHVTAQRGRLRDASAVPRPGSRPCRGGGPPARPRRR